MSQKKQNFADIFAAAIKYARQLRIHGWDQECDVMISKEKKKKKKNTPTSRDLRQGRQLPSRILFEKKREKKKQKGKNEPQYESLGEGPTLSRSLKAEKLSKRVKPEPDLFTQGWCGKAKKRP